MLLYALVSSGLPIPTPRKPAGTPFPCAERACGCATADACWAGACCCFSAREKLAWADAHGFTPPAHFLRAVERELEAATKADECPHCAAKKSCCSSPKSAPKPVGGWLVGLSALKCKGQSAGGLSVLPPALPPVPSAILAGPVARPSFARLADQIASARADRPASPPPRF